MKTKLILIVLAFIALGTLSFAHGKTGLYLSADDYKKDKLTYESDCHGGAAKIRLHDALGSNPKLTIVQDGKKIEHKKSDVFGFRDCDGKVYRFYKNSKYELVDSGNVFIYIHQEQMPAGKGFKLSTVYYFSATAEGNIVPLTMNDLHRAYSGQDKFISRIDEMQAGSGLLAYDRMHHRYMINTIYSETVK